MRIVLGEIPDENDYNEFGFFLNLFYSYGIIYVGLIIGCIIALLFIFTDVFILKKKLDSDLKSFMIRMVILIVIAFSVGIIHYLLEKVIDII